MDDSFDRFIEENVNTREDVDKRRSNVTENPETTIWNANQSVSSPSVVNNKAPTMKNDILSRLAEMEKKMLKQQTDMQQIIFNNRTQKANLQSLLKENEELRDKIYWLENDVASLNQYSRRENIEIAGIPEKVNQKTLEKHIIDVLKSINVNVTSYNLVAVHRLGKKNRDRPRNVIVRFINRKDAFASLKNKKDLKKTAFKNYMIHENLCPVYKKIYNECKRNENIRKVWSYNGVVHVKFTDDEFEEPTKIFHFEDIDTFINDDTSLDF